MWNCFYTVELHALSWIHKYHGKMGLQWLIWINTGLKVQYSSYSTVFVSVPNNSYTLKTFNSVGLLWSSANLKMLLFEGEGCWWCWCDSLCHLFVFLDQAAWCQQFLFFLLRHYKSTMPSAMCNGSNPSFLSYKICLAFLS